jgi:bacillithiol system protein YtxJ
VGLEGCGTDEPGQQGEAGDPPDPPATLNPMSPDLIAVEAMESLDRLIVESAVHPLVIFKHSRSCGVSAEALDQLREHLSIASPGTRYAIITVQTHRDLSNAVSARLGIRHETPQAILIRHGRAVWTASHWRVNAAALQRAVG